MEERLVKGVLQSNTTVRLQVAEELLTFLSDPSSSLTGFEDLDQVIEGLVAWLGSSHFKVSINAMEIIVLLSQRNKDLVRHHMSTILPSIRERLGDLKDQVRVHSTQLIMKLMDFELIDGQMLEEFLLPALVHKNWRVKEESMECLAQVLAKFGNRGLHLSKLVGVICKLLEDPNHQVRIKSMDTLVVIYKNVGEKVRNDILKRGLPQARLTPLLTKFDEVLANGQVEAEEVAEQTDTGSAQPTSLYGTLPRKKGKTPSSSTSKAATSSGTIDEAAFEKAFEETPPVNLALVRDLSQEVSQIQLTLEDDQKPWDVRSSALKKLRGVIKGGAMEQDDFNSHIRGLEVALITSVKDLRSQVCREACITLSFLAVHYKGNFVHVAEAMLTPLILLLPNSAKVMASSADVCIKYFINYIHNHHLVPPIIQAATQSKSAVSRRFCWGYIDLISHTWDLALLEKHGQMIEKILGRGVSDADPMARQHARRTFWGYNEWFPNIAERILDSLSSQVQKRLKEERATHTQPINNKRSESSRNLSAASEPDLLEAINRVGSGVDGSADHVLSSSSAVSLDLTHNHGNLRAKTPPATLHKRVRPPSDTTPPSPTPNRRPKSSMGSHVVKKSQGRLPLPTNSRRARSTNPSPAVSREASPTRSVKSYRPNSRTAISRNTLMTKDVLLHIKSQFGSRDDEDETGSVASMGSVSSEMSTFNPSMKFPNPVESVSDLLQMCSSSQWSERRDGIGQLELLLEGERELTPQERNLVKEVFRRMLVESHIKVFAVFLEVLVKYINVYQEDLNGWLFKLLLRLLHKQGTDMLSSVHRKLDKTLECIRNTYSAQEQLHILCQIVVDKAQPMNPKVKQSWLLYFIALVKRLESGDFNNTPETRQALSKIVTMAMEPKSVDIRNLGKKALISLFQHNTAIIGKMLQSLPQQLQETADRILRSYTSKLVSSSSEESSSSDNESPVSSPVKKIPPSHFGRSKTPSYSPLIKKSVSKSPSETGIPPVRLKSKVMTPLQAGHPSSALKRSYDIIGSSPDVRSKTPSSGRRSGIPPPSPRTPVGDSRIPRSGRPITPSSSAGRRIARPKSTDPRLSGLHRPTSAKSDYVPGYYMNGQMGIMSAVGRLAQLNYSGDDADLEIDHIARALKQLTAAQNNVELRIKALQVLLNLAKNADYCNWEEHSNQVMHKLMELIMDESAEVKVLALKVLKEVIKVKPQVLHNVTELVIMKVLKSCLDKESHKTAMEDVIPVLAEAVDPVHGLPILVQVVTTETDNNVISPLKLISQLLPRCEKSLVLKHMKVLMESLLKLYGHSESSIRKLSVFCLVAVHKVVAIEMEPYLENITSSQRKLLDIYIKKSSQTSS